MTNETLFDGDKPEDTKEKPAAIVEGETPPDLSMLEKRLNDSQAHIAKIEAENKELRDKQVQAAAVEDILGKINLKQNEQTQQETAQASQGVSPEDIQKYITAGIEASNLKATMQSNRALAEEKLRAQFGDKAKEVYQSKALELKSKGLNLYEMISKDSNLVDTFFPSSQVNPTNTMPHQTSVNSGAYTTPPGGLYSEMLKNKPKGVSPEKHFKSMYDEAMRVGPQEFFGTS